MVVPDVEELTVGEPAQVVLENARRKARAGAERTAAGEGALVLAVDTDVAVDGRLLGKAESEEEARERLELLSGRTHAVLSGVAVLPGDLLRDGESGSPVAERTAVATSRVTFRALEPALVELYLRAGEWRDRAGAYAIQGLGSILVEEVRGDFSNVVGLPVRTLLELAPELFCLHPPSDRREP